MGTSKLLSLPPELLVSICNFLDEDGENLDEIFSVRLSCKMLREAVFDKWCARLLRSRSLWIAKEKSLHNLRCLVANGAFARRIQVVTLSLLDARSINPPLLVRTLADLSQASIEVAVRLARREESGEESGEESEEESEEDLSRSFNPFLRRSLNQFLLYAVLSSGCKMSKIRMDDCPDINPKLLDLPGVLSFKDLAKELKEIEYLPYTDQDDDSLDLDESLERHRGRLILLQKAHKLEKLSLSQPNTGTLGGAYTEEILSEFLLANPYSCLKEISLKRVEVFTSDIIKLLQRCGATLESFFFHGSLYSHYQPQWLDVMKQLQQCDKLCWLKIARDGTQDEEMYETVTPADEDGDLDEGIDDDFDRFYCKLSSLDDNELPQGLHRASTGSNIEWYIGKGIPELLALSIKDYRPERRLIIPYSRVLEQAVLG